MDRTDQPAEWDERSTLSTMLDYARATVHAKCEGLTDAGARAAPLATSPLMTIGGLVSHVHWVEYWWLQVVFLGEEDAAPWTDEEPDREFSLGAQVPLADLLEAYEKQCARYRDLVAAHDLDARAERPVHGGDHPTLRWIVCHLIEETARHNGHIDILRELADGVTGH